MTIDLEKLKEYLRAGDLEDSFIEDCLAEATELVDGYIGESPIPEVRYDLAVKKTAAELYAQRDAPQGVSQFSDLDNVQPIRVARDPLTAAKPILRKYKTGLA